MTLEASVRERAAQWAEIDPNQVTANHVKNLLAQSEDGTAAATKELTNLFPNDRIGFGTAGLRSTMTPGPMGMNDLVVVQAAQGIVKYVLQQKENEAVKSEGKLCAVIGYDHRENKDLELSSLSFALLSVLVFEQAGMETILLDGLVATPLVPFTLSQKKNAVVGIMITASHNPKNDAGYKVYWNNGCQIRAPVDKGIANSILDNLTPWIDYGALLKTKQEQHPNDPCRGLSSPDTTKEMITAYFGAIQSCGLVAGQAKLVSQFTEDSWKPPSIAYTAMHGVGLPFAVRSYETFGFPPFHPVPSQMKPDPTFPTVPFPNPEEKGALDLAKAFAEENGCDVVLANDPDADRLAVAEKDRTTGAWTVFSGDQIGTMLGCWLYEQVGKPSGKRVSMCASTVSSKMLAEVARVEGFYFEDTLTGFKWIGSRAEELNRDGYFALFGYEEAIGFSCGNVVFDKDGISALGVFTELTYYVYHKGMSLSQHMQGLYDKYGEFVSNNGYFILKDPSVVQKIMDIMTCNGQFTLDTVGPYKVQSTRYLGDPAFDSTTSDNLPRLPTSKSSPMMTLSFANGCVAQFRASGTEPKFKYYIEMKGQVGVSREKVQSDLMQFSETIIQELVKPEEHGLIVPSKG